jgi:hypothetical protein
LVPKPKRPAVLAQTRAVHAHRFIVKRIATAAWIICSSPAYLSRCGTPRSFAGLSDFRLPELPRAGELDFVVGVPASLTLNQGDMLFTLPSAEYCSSADVVSARWLGWAWRATRSTTRSTCWASCFVTVHQTSSCVDADSLAPSRVRKAASRRRIRMPARGTLPRAVH